MIMPHRLHHSCRFSKRGINFLLFRSLNRPEIVFIIVLKTYKNVLLIKLFVPNLIVYLSKKHKQFESCKISFLKINLILVNLELNIRTKQYFLLSTFFFFTAGSSEVLTCWFLVSDSEEFLYL